MTGAAYDSRSCSWIRITRSSMSQVVQDEQRERLTRIVAAASLVASSIYIVWRWGWPLDGETLWFSLPLVLAETYGLVAAALLTYSAWRLRVRQPLPAP